MSYINRELALKLLKRNSITSHITFSDGVSIYDTIANIPTADVVPKSEVAQEFTCFVGDPHRVDRCPYLDEIEKAQAEVAREIFADIDGFIEKNIKEITKAYEGGRANGKTFLCDKFSAFIDMKKYFAVLKKKYTEDQHDG